MNDITDNTGKSSRFKLVLIIAQLAIVLSIIYKFRIEEGHGLLLAVFPIFGGFIIHSFLPYKFRLPFFLFLSILTFGIVLGLLNTIILVGIGLIIIGIVHLPVRFNYRILLLMIVVGILVLFRTDIIKSEMISLLIPILGAIFMFRLILYVYEMKKKPLKASIWQRLSYFFLLPNVLFPLFPIVDYKTFLNTYYDTDEYQIYQKGVSWIFRGVTHLLLYKLIYYYFSPSPADVVNTASLIEYLLSSYSLLFRISGQSHLIIGTLALFGFNLPVIFNKYFLASGFNDFWRRINIYWKDFVMKIFYYPLFFLFRRFGMTVSTIITLLIIFFITWMLHSYQWFWLQGIFPLKVVDGLFWGIFGVLIVLNSVIQSKRKKKVKLGSARWDFWESSRQSLKIVAMFTFMCLLWSLWMSESVNEWISIISVGYRNGIGDLLLVLLVLIFLVLVFALIQYPINKLKKLSYFSKPTFYNTAFTTSLFSVIILLIAFQNIYAPKKSKLASFVRTLQETGLNARDSEIAERGYYEPILKGNQLTMQLMSSESQKPSDWVPMYESDASYQTNDLYFIKLKPSNKSIFKRAVLTTNKWGMRDKEYTIRKPENTFRMALLGTSFEMGSGVNDNEVFEQLVEDRLNNEYSAQTGLNYEILNFAVGGYHLIQNVKLTDEAIEKFNPDVALYFAHSKESRRVIDRIIRFYLDTLDLEYDFLRNLKSEAGIKKGMTHAEVQKRLLPFGDKIVEWGYNKIANSCIEKGIKPVWIFLPTIEGIMNEPANDRKRVEQFAVNAGFFIISLEQVFTNQDTKEIRVAPWDMHPNAKGHQLIAEMLYSKLINYADQIGLNK